ncbi:Spx/MgsR family RNA polymerase-binding regulatory protein [Sedimenticola hydrogenitrophicus]|uniref:Spx/MgsR family RNA polymerase-binding regulatory protein n=1 Tax=Sedimenticola hydrogenitrophicus TaxID=2967975 RepID=UPI0021A650F1|nr:Spx/MgsR family RNA polymerase-binding regulatory protein [Sedimenticola hydrogenitrophicus]
MSILKVYAYANCGTCRKAKKYLTEHGIEFTEIPIREHPPTELELRTMLDACDGQVTRLFNTSGQDYRQGGFKEKLKTLSDVQAISALAANGNLIKRPFVISDSVAVVGFNQDLWDSLF